MARNLRARERRTSTAPRPAVPAEIEKLGRFMDESIRLPGGFRIGWDAIIGLVPGIGDAVGTAISGYIVLSAARAGVAGSVLLRMVANVGLETLVGIVPIVGDIFDAIFKANVRNIELFRRYQGDPTATKHKSTRVVALVVVALLALAVAFVALVVRLVAWLWTAIG
jgi:hypothetical protein